MRRIITISYTGLDAGGGVPKWNRDLHAAFPDRETIHYCWDDALRIAGVSEPGRMYEWERATVLNRCLIWNGLITDDDVVVADGFWASGLERHPRTISVAHGIWSHLTKEDVDAGKQPEFPLHHGAQVRFRQHWIDSEKPIVSVSDFIAEQCRLQWGWDIPVIDNAVDTNLYRPNPDAKYVYNKPDGRKKPIVVHAVTTANKGFDHIEEIKQTGYFDVYSIDELSSFLKLPKHEAIAHADIAVHPSAYEGNSMAVAEFLSCGLPLIAYDVGFCWKIKHDDQIEDEMPYVWGKILRRCHRSPFTTLDHLEGALTFMSFDPTLAERWGKDSRAIAEQYLSIDLFRWKWRQAVDNLE